jgi:flagellar secretion chaperone FliS
MALTSPIQRLRAAAEAMTPERLVVLLYERLLRDVDEAAAALTEGDRYVGHRALLHAQEIIAELDAALDPGIWNGAAQLSDVYRFVTGRLVMANVGQDPAPLQDCRAVLEPLLGAWTEAWRQGSDGAGAGARPATASTRPVTVGGTPAGEPPLTAIDVSG